MKTPQRKPNKSMTGEELLIKAMTGKHKLPSQKEKKEAEIAKIINSK